MLDSVAPTFQAIERSRWHDDLRGAVRPAPHSDPRHDADRLSRVQLALLALMPALCDGATFPALPPLPPAMRRALVDVSTDSLYYLVGGEDQGIQPLYQRMADRQAIVAAEVAARLTAAGIEPLLYKGVELRHRLLGGRAVSTSTDIDLLVREPDVEHARRTLLAAGFVHAEYDPNTGTLLELTAERVAAHEARHRELYPLCRLVAFPLDPAEAALVRAADMTPLFVHGDRGLFLDVIDLHHALFRNMPADPLFERAVPSVHPDAVTLSATDHLWTSCLRFYLESSVARADPKQRDLAYLAGLLSRGGFDWPLLVDTAAGADLRPAFFYTLRLLDRLRVGDVPAWVLDALHPRRGSHHLDFGCRATRALGLVEGASESLRPLSA